MLYTTNLADSVYDGTSNTGELMVISGYVKTSEVDKVLKLKLRVKKW